MPFDHPGGVQEAPEKPEKNSNYSKNGNDEFAHDFFTSVQQTFHDYNNRDSGDNRSAQVHMGPSEIGSPCDRRIAMSLMGIPAVNPGGDGFAAWLGTQGHRGMADIYTWANGRSGRYAVETRLNFPSKLVPRGTGDLLDRAEKWRCFVDWKFMGFWSLKKLIESGPSLTYYVQIQTYAFGAAQRGEKVKRIVICGLPRQGKSLDEGFAWSAPYDPTIGEAGLRRVDEIGKKIEPWLEGTTAHERDQVLRQFPIAKDCDYCPHYLTKSSDLSHACNGRP